MRTSLFLHTIIAVFLMISTQVSVYAYSLNGKIIDAANNEALSFATVSLKTANNMHYGVVTDQNGAFKITNLPEGKYALAVSYLGYDDVKKRVDLPQDSLLIIKMATSAKSLSEVVVTASESKGATSASKIDVEAMQHLQPSSFTDLLELLPGGKSYNPDMGSANFIRLREAGSADATISSLGVGFVVDGAPINNDANLQRLPGTSSNGSQRESVSKGVDMRTLPTDNIESVEIVRGIPSVEYGNITGGLVNIKRKWGASPFTARFKADQVSKLFSVGKGWNIASNRILNADVSYLDSKVDPRDSRANYKRITVSMRLTTNFNTRFGHLDLNFNGDYTGSFDNVKRDKDITIKDDMYKSSYDRFMLASSLQLKRGRDSFLKRLQLNISATQELSKIKEIKTVSLDRPTAMPTSMVEGEFDGEYLPYRYNADMIVDGKPLYANAKIIGDFSFKCRFVNSIKIGAEWNFSKNYGDGRVYDITRPIVATSATRPRSYKEIPARHDLSLYAEGGIKIPFYRNLLNLSAGVRANTMYGISKDFSLYGHYYLDPRFNIKWDLPSFGTNKDWFVSFAFGLGWMSKMPTTAQMYPDKLYIDIVQLNYYHTNPDYRRLNLKTYILDNTNYNLQPSRNRKWEVRMDIAHKGHNLSVTYFNESMNNAFGGDTYYKIFSYKKYDSASNPNPNAKPDLTAMTYVDEAAIDVYSMTGNTTSVRKKGVEFTYSSPRVKSIKTRFTVNGAWISTIYSTIKPQYQSKSLLINGEQLSYVGLYDWEDGMERGSLNTNIIADTYLDNIGMLFSITAQCTWFTSTRPLWNSGVPVSYVDKNGVSHEFTSESLNDPQLRHLVQTYSNYYFDESVIPFAATFNLKATKEIGKHFKVSLFVNRILAITPDYHVGTQLIRRSTNPYFGMEANFKF